MLSGKCKWKQQWETTTQELEWPISGILTTPNAATDMEKQVFSLITSGNTKWYRHFGSLFGGFLKN